MTIDLYELFCVASMVGLKFFFENFLKKKNFFKMLCIFLILLFYLFFFKIYYSHHILLNFYQKFKYLNLLEISLIFITILISCLCYALSLKKVLKNNKIYLNFYWFFNFIILFLVFSKTTISFFIFYEMFLLPSVILVYISSPNKRSLKVSVYFLIWTQLGSFLIFLACVVLFNSYNVYYFFDATSKVFFQKWKYFHVFLLLGFFIKIPTWPFHFWLTKTHVEANTGFSIFLSGVLVKIAVVGLYKFMPFFSYLNKNVFLFIAIISIIDVALKIPFQTDLKKIVAYSTIFEMNYIILNFSFFSNNSIYIITMFLIFHTCISTLFFFLVDVLYKNYNSRVVNTIKNLNKTSYLLSIYLILCLNFFSGFPFTIKFNLEMFILNKLFMYSFPLFMFTLIFIFLFNFFFFKHFISMLFGTSLNSLKLKTMSLFEIFLFSLIFFFLIFLNIF